MRFVGFALCLSFAVAAPAVWERVRISGDSGERVVEGRVVVEAQDGSLLVEHADQRLEVVPGAEVQSREAVPTTPEPLTPRAVGDAVLRTLPDECGPSSATFESWREPSGLAGADGDEKPLGAVDGRGRSGHRGVSSFWLGSGILAVRSVGAAATEA